MTSDTIIRPVNAADAEAICGIYNHYVRTSIVTFEEEDVAPPDMAARIAAATAILPWLVAERDGEILGYAYGRKFHERAAYRHTIESGIYLSPQKMRQRIDTALYQALFERFRTLPVHTVLANIALPNPESIALHEKMGFQKIGHMEQVGFKFGRWIDAEIWQLVFA